MDSDDSDSTPVPTFHPYKGKPSDFVASPTFPTPTIIPPLHKTHKSTIIFLHGRGDTSRSFSLILRNPASRTNTTLTWRDRLPYTKFIFPQTKLRLVSKSGAIMNEWFDLWDLFHPDSHSELQLTGLREASSFIHELITHEVEECGIPPGKIILGGISQGCATGLHALFSWEGGGLGGFVGFSGWMPFYKKIIAQLIYASGWDVDEKRKGVVRWIRRQILNPKDNEEAAAATGSKSNKNDFTSTATGEQQAEGGEGSGSGGADGGSSSTQQQQQPTPSEEILRTPVFLGHGSEDEKVNINLGQDIRTMCQAFGMDVTWKQYEYGHWYMVPEELEDVVDWIAEKGWEKGWEEEIDDGGYEPREDDDE